MFQFRRFPSYTYGFSVWYLTVGFPIRKSPDRSSFAAPRSLSQLITSFIGSWCQGIPLALLLAWPLSLTNRVWSNNWFSIVELCRLSIFGSYLSVQQKLFFTLKKIIYPLLLPSHNCIINSQCSVFKVHFRVPFEKETQWSNDSSLLQSIPF